MSVENQRRAAPPEPLRDEELGAATGGRRRSPTLLRKCATGKHLDTAQLTDSPGSSWDGALAWLP